LILQNHKTSPRRRKRFSRKVLATIVVFCILTPALFTARLSAQKTENKPTRKLVYKESPGYPLTLREAHIGGVVRLEIIVSAKGNVDSVTPLGGNPVLVEAASAAVRGGSTPPLTPRRRHKSNSPSIPNTRTESCQPCTDGGVVLPCEPANSTPLSWRNTFAHVISSATAQLNKKNHPIPIRNEYTNSLFIKAAPNNRKLLRNVSIDPAPCSFGAIPILLNDDPHRVQAA